MALRLPVEIWLIILESLDGDRSTLATLSLVSREMQITTFSLLHRSYRFCDQHDLMLLCDRLELEESSHQSKHRLLAPYIRELKCIDASPSVPGLAEPQMAQSLTIRLASLIPRLVNLHSVCFDDLTPERPWQLFPKLLEHIPRLRKLGVAVPGIVFSTDINRRWAKQTFVFSHLRELSLTTARGAYQCDSFMGYWLFPFEAGIEMIRRCRKLESLVIDVHFRGNAQALFPLELPFLHTFGIGGAQIQCFGGEDRLVEFLEGHPSIQTLLLKESTCAEGDLGDLELSEDALPYLKRFTGTLRMCLAILNGCRLKSVRELFQVPLDRLIPNVHSSPVPSNSEDETSHQDLRSSRIYSDQYRHFKFLFRVLSSCHLTILRIGSQINFDADLLMSISRSLPALSSLSLENKFEGDTNAFLGAIGSFKHLRKLNNATVFSILEETAVEAYQHFVEQLATFCPLLDEIERNPRSPYDPRAIVSRSGKHVNVTVLKPHFEFILHDHPEHLDDDQDLSTWLNDSDTE